MANLANSQHLRLYLVRFSLTFYKVWTSSTPFIVLQKIKTYTWLKHTYDGAVAIVDRVNLFVVGSSVAPKGEFINSELFLLVVGRQK
jgi:hypothetical protein